MRISYTSLPLFLLVFSLHLQTLLAQSTRLLRQPDLSDTHVTFAYGSDIWVSELATNQVRRITSTAAVESDPHFSPDGQWIAFSSNRSGASAVYVVSINGGDAKCRPYVFGVTTHGKKLAHQPASIGLVPRSTSCAHRE